MATPPSYRIDFMRAARRHSAFLHDVLAPRCRAHDITVQQLCVLVELDADGAQTVTQLCEQTGILRTNFAATCRKLQSRGLVERTPNPRDSRSSLVALTEKGREAVLAIDREIADAFDCVLADVPEQTILAIEKSLGELDRLLERLSERTKTASDALRQDAETGCPCSDS